MPDNLILGLLSVLGLGLLSYGLIILMFVI
jgi:hypothetical protein